MNSIVFGRGDSRGKIEDRILVVYGSFMFIIAVNMYSTYK